MAPRTTSSVRSATPHRGDPAAPQAGLSRRTFLGASGAAAGLATAAFWSHPAPAGAEGPDEALDHLVLGDERSERDHGLEAELSDALSPEDAALGLPARVFHPTEPTSYWGGGARVRMAVARRGTTYVSVKLWGGDYDTTDGHEWKLHLYAHIDGTVQQIGYQDQGVLDSLDARHWGPRSPGRFFLHTVALPEHLTEGRKHLDLEIRATGRIWSYGGTPEMYFRHLVEDSRPVYALYTHSAPSFRPGSDDEFGAAPAPVTAPADDQAVLDAVRDRVRDDLADLLAGRSPAAMDGWQIQQLVEAYLWEDPEGVNPGVGDPGARARVLAALDARCRAWREDPVELTGSDQQWQGFGRYALALLLLGESDRELLEEELDRPLAEQVLALTNPGFEIGEGTAAGWRPAGWLANQGEVGRVTDTFPEQDGGGASLRIRNAAGQTTIVDNSSRVAVAGGAELTVSAWIRTEGTETAAHRGAALNLVFRDDQDVIQKLDGADDTRIWAPKDSDTTPWTRVERTLVVPEGATVVAVSVRLWGAGTAWFDAVSVPAQAPEADPDVPRRRAAYGDMMVAHMDHWRRQFPHYTNQVLIAAIGLHQVARALQLYFPDRAAQLTLQEEDVLAESRAYVEEALGLRPWRGKLEEDMTTRRAYLGDSYLQFTRAGLSRELGYVGNYGEVHDWLAMLWEAIVRGEDAPDPEEGWVRGVRERLLQISRQRLWFRVLDLDADGRRVAREQTVLGWRNEVFPGKDAYVQPTSWDGNPLQAVATYGADDETLVGAVHELVTDGQLGSSLDLLVTRAGGRVGLNAFRFVAHHLPRWEEIAADGPSGASLPTGEGSADGVFADPENGVVAVHRGADTLWASTYFRARQGINGYGRVHLIRDGLHRSATVRLDRADSRPFELPPGFDGPLDPAFGEDSFTIPGDVLTFDYAINDAGAPETPGLFDLPADPLGRIVDGNGLGGVVLPRARLAADVLDPTLGLSDRPAIETMLVGRPEIAVLEYDDYLVIVNPTSSIAGDPDGARTVEVDLPGSGRARVLYSGGPSGSTDDVDRSAAPAAGARVKRNGKHRVTVPPMTVIVMVSD